MKTKFKKIETRLHPEDYLRLKAIADKYEISVYGIVQDFIGRGIGECYSCDGARAVTVFVDNEMYDKLSEIAEEYDGTIKDVAWNCIRNQIERLEKEKRKKVIDDKNRQE